MKDIRNYLNEQNWSGVCRIYVLLKSWNDKMKDICAIWIRRNGIEICSYDLFVLEVPLLWRTYMFMFGNKCFLFSHKKGIYRFYFVAYCRI